MTSRAAARFSTMEDIVSVGGLHENAWDVRWSRLDAVSHLLSLAPELWSR